MSYDQAPPPPGGGNPYGASVTANGQPLSEEDKASIRHQARRQVEVTRKLKG